jgi:hypothetical protein
MKDAKLAVLNEWDDHLRTAHPRQWEREQRKEAGRHAAAERSAQKSNRSEGHERYGDFREFAVADIVRTATIYPAKAASFDENPYSAPFLAIVGVRGIRSVRNAESAA